MNIKILHFLLFTCTLFLACTCSNPSKASKSSEAARGEGTPEIRISQSLFYNRDSVLWYAERAYKYNDPKGCFVVGTCYYLDEQDPHFPEDIYVVSHEEADTFLMISAAQNYQPAINLIHCLHENDRWNHEY